MFSIISAARFRRKKHKHGSTVRVKIIISLLRAVVLNWNFDLSAGNLTDKLINLGFPRCKTNSKLDFRRKRQGYDGKKPTWNALWRNISRDLTGHKQTRIRSETHWKLLFYLDFRSYFEAASPNCFNVSGKILLQSIFVARIINKNKNKSKNLKISRNNSEATSGHQNATWRHSWASRIPVKRNCKL